MRLMSYGSLFGRSTNEARHDNWTSYLDFIRKTSGELLEADKDLTHKRELLKQLSEPAVRTRQPLASGEAFYRNCDKLRDDPRSLDEKTLTLAFTSLRATSGPASRPLGAPFLPSTSATTCASELPATTSPKSFVMYACSARCLRPVASITSSGFPCRASRAGRRR